MSIWSSINCPTVICLPTVCYFFSREATSETYGPRVSFSYYLPLRSTFPLLLFSDLLNQKYKNTLLHFILFAIYLFNLLQLPPIHAPISGAVTRKGLTTPLTRRVATICYMCARAIYVVLLGSPTGSITLVPYMREIPTANVLHHPLLFGEIQRSAQEVAAAIRPTSACSYYYYSTHRPLSSMHLEY